VVHQLRQQTAGGSENTTRIRLHLTTYPYLPTYLPTNQPTDLPAS
jgi:hypothetical protein